MQTKDKGGLQETLTEHLDVVEDDCCPRLSDPVVSHAAVGPRILLTGGIDEEVAQQEACLVVASDTGTVLGPGDARGWDPTGHTLQDETLAFGDNDGLCLWGVDDAGSLSSGAWRDEEGKDSMWDQDFVQRVPSTLPWVTWPQETIPQSSDLESNSLQRLTTYTQWDKLLNSPGPWVPFGTTFCIELL